MMQSIHARILLVVLTIVFPFSGIHGQVNIDATADAKILVGKILGGPGVRVKDVRYKGSPNAIGKFTKQKAIPDMEEGFVMSTGDVSTIPGPNKTSKTGTAHGLPGETQMKRVIRSMSYDAAVLDFNLQPAFDSLVIDFAFASEEYGEFLNTEFEDGFMILLFGPGLPPAGKNLGVIPGSDDAITIHTVNMRYNRKYFLNNNHFNRVGQVDEEKLAAIPPALHNGISFDGMTRKISIGTIVEPRGSYRMRIIVADGSDDEMDSAVFLAANSLTSIPRYRVNKKLVNKYTDEFARLVKPSFAKLDSQLRLIEVRDSIIRDSLQRLALLAVDSAHEDSLTAIMPDSEDSNVEFSMAVPPAYRVAPDTNSTDYRAIISFVKDTLKLPQRETDLLDAIAGHLRKYPGLFVELYAPQFVADATDNESFMPELRARRIRYHLVAEGIDANRIRMVKNSFLSQELQESIRPYYVEITVSPD